MNIIHIEISAGLEARIPQTILECAALETLRQQSISDSDLTLFLSNDDTIRQLNLDFLSNDTPTDVLSFPSRETDPETGRRYLGDVIISLPRASEQAERAGHTVEAEVQLLAIHGVLHLLGHDHADAEEKARMWTAQAQVLESIGLGNIHIKE